MKVNYVPDVMKSNPVTSRRNKSHVKPTQIRWHYHKPTRRTSVAVFLTTKWLPSLEREIEPTTFVSTRNMVLRYILPGIGEYQVGSVSRDVLKTFYEYLLNEPVARGGKQLTKSSVQHIHATIHWAFQDLVDNDVIDKNPAAGIRPKKRKSEQYEIQIWSPEQLNEFLHSVKRDPLYPLWHLLAFTGMRRGEALGLRWEDLRLDQHEIAIRRALSMADGRLYFTTPKSAQVRVVEIDPRTKTVMKQHKKRVPSSSGNLIFRDEDGSPLIPNAVTKRFIDLVKGNEQLPRIRLHDLRHSHASHLILSGANIKTVQERLGHSDVVVTLNLYSHVLPTTQRAAVQGLMRYYRDGP